jgi:hypothetical protein
MALSFFFSNKGKDILSWIVLGIIDFPEIIVVGVSYFTFIVL